MEKTSYKYSVQKKPASSFDPYCPLPKEQWEKKMRTPKKMSGMAVSTTALMYMKK